MKAIKVFSKYLCGVCLLAASLIGIAGQVSVEPQISYLRSTNGGETVEYSSLSNLISDANVTEEMLYNKCMATGAQNNAFTCNKLVFTSSINSPAAIYYNGIPTAIQLWGYTETSSKSFYDPKVHHQTTGTSHKQTVIVQHNCTPPFSRSVSGDTSNSKALECSYTEPQACPADGNPINIGTAEKFEKEIDYSTADGILRAERFYQNQYSGWTINSPYDLVFAPANGSSSPAMRHTVGKIHKRHSLDINDPKRLIDVVHIEPTKYINLQSQPIIYLTLDRLRYRFKETENGLIGEGPIATKIQLARVNPASANGASWKLVSENGDISYFFSDGSLKYTQFAQGGNLTYSYSGGKLVSKTDHLGRSITYTYDNYDQVVSTTLPDGQVIIYDYGSDNTLTDFKLLKSVTWPNGESISYSYNEAIYIGSGTNTLKMLTGKFDSYMNRIGTYKYNSGKAISTEGALGSFKRTMTHYSNFTQVKDGLNSTRNYYFNTILPDGTKLVTSTNQPAGSGCAAATQSATYYADGLKKSETNFNGHKTQFAYDSARALETVRVEGIPSGNGTDYLPANC